MAAKLEDMKEVVVFHQETIKPSSPTPPPLRSFKLSLFDQLMSRALTPMVFFYENIVGGDPKDNNDIEANISNVSQHLKKSLSEALTRFYPLAGRLDKHIPLINCNDEGVPFLLAQANFSLSDVLQEPKHEELTKCFVPTGFENLKAELFPLLIVQVTFFKCGGMAICVLLSHKIADAKSISIFIDAWAKLSTGNHVEMIPHISTAADRFPAQPKLPVDPRKLEPDPAVFMGMPTYITKRFVFNDTKMNALRTKAASATVPHPTRNEAILSLLWRCSLNKTNLRNSGSGKPSNLSFSINVRNRLTPPIPDFSLGNAIVQTTFSSDTTLEGLPTFVCKIREELQQLFNRLKEHGANKEHNSMILELFMDYIKEMNKALSGDVDGYGCSNICGMGFREIDFGWGKPTWATLLLSFMTMFSDAREGNGVDVWVSLPEESMALLEQNPEFLEFASVNPSCIPSQT